MWLRRKRILAQTKTKKHFNVQTYIRDSLELTLDYSMHILKLMGAVVKQGYQRINQIRIRNDLLLHSTDLTQFDALPFQKII